MRGAGARVLAAAGRRLLVATSRRPDPPQTEVEPGDEVARRRLVRRRGLQTAAGAAAVSAVPRRLLPTRRSLATATRNRHDSVHAHITSLHFLAYIS